MAAPKESILERDYSMPKLLQSLPEISAIFPTDAIGTSGLARQIAMEYSDCLDALKRFDTTLELEALVKQMFEEALLQSDGFAVAIAVNSSVL